MNQPATSQPRAEVSAPRKRRYRAWLMLAVGAALLGYVITRVPLSEIAAVLARVEPRYVAATLACGLVATALRALRYALFFPPRGRWVGLYGAFASMRMINLVFPLHTGEIAFLGLLKRSGFGPSIAEILPIWVILRVFDLVAVAVWLSVVTAVLPVTGFVGQVRWLLAGAAALGLVALVGALWFPVSPALARRAPWLFSRIASARDALKRGFDLRRLVAALFVSILLWAVMAAIGGAALLAFQPEIPVPTTVSAAVITQAVSLLPIHAPLAIGTGEAVWTTTLCALGVTTEVAAPLAVALRMLVLFTVVFDGCLGVVITLATSGGRAMLSGATTVDRPVAADMPREIGVAEQSLERV